MDDQNPNQKTIFATSVKLDDDGVAEMVYDPRGKKTKFALIKKGKVEYQESLILKDEPVVEPWPSDHQLIKSGFAKLPSEAVETASNLELFEGVREFIKKYVQVSEEYATVSGVYVLMTWLYDQFDVIPYLRVIGDLGTGKSRFIKSVGEICYKPMIIGASATLAAIFRTLDIMNGTLVFDEADFRSSESWNEIVKILNSGHSSGCPVIRMEAKSTGDGFNIKTFNVFGPKILASRERFRDEALESRCLSYTLFPQTKLKVPVHLPAEFKTETLGLRNKLLYFRLKNVNKVNVANIAHDTIGIPRLKQSFLAELCVAKMIGEEPYKKILSFAKQYETEFINQLCSSVQADVLISIVILMNDENFLKRNDRKIRIKEIGDNFENENYNEYLEKFENHGPYYSRTVKVSYRQIGEIVRRKLHITTLRDRGGFFIPPTEHKKIYLLVERYGLQDYVKDMLAAKKEAEEERNHKVYF